MWVKKSMKSKYSIYILLHIAIIVMWSFFYKFNLITNDAVEINALSMILLVCFISALYVYIMTSQKKTDIVDSIDYTVPILFCSSMIHRTGIIIFEIAFVLFLLYKARNLLARKRYKEEITVLISYFLGLLFYINRFVLFSSFMIVLGMAVDIFVKYKWINFKYVHILPTSAKKSKYILTLWIPLVVYISYIFDWDSFCLNMIFQVFMLLFEILTMIHIEDRQEFYREISSFFFLTKYINTERENFSRILHDDIVQDIRASYNLLALEQPDIVLSKKVLLNLEDRARKMMNFYSANIFLEYGAYINLENMLNSIQAIYPNKKVQLKIDINEKAEKYLKNKVHLEMLLQISKELINNIFKHSNATYIKYEIKMDENMVLIINCKSDGASAIDYENIFKSKGGVLLLRVLVEANNGKLTYNYSNGILWSSVELEVD